MLLYLSRQDSQLGRETRQTNTPSKTLWAVFLRHRLFINSVGSLIRVLSFAVASFSPERLLIRNAVQICRTHRIENTNVA